MTGIVLRILMAASSRSICEIWEFSGHLIVRSNPFFISSREVGFAIRN